jgi:hypothetical protein
MRIGAALGQALFICPLLPGEGSASLLGKTSVSQRYQE